jgi:protein Mpv17
LSPQCSFARRGSRATSTSAAKESKSFVQWYESHLLANPVRTKMVSGAILWGLGDVVAQVVPVLAFGDSNSVTSSNTTEEVVAKTSLPLFAYDYARTARVVFYGFAIHAPISHLHYNFLEWMTVKLGLTGLSVSIFKTTMEQFVYWSWFSNSLYHGALGALQGQSFDQIYHRIADVLWETQKAQWAFWIPIQLLNFRFVPVRHQLNVVLITSVAWSAMLSMWYPPDPKTTAHVDATLEK